MSLPPDSADIQYLFRADAGTYQDTAGATPAAADGDAVALWRDQAQNHNDALAAADATLKTNQINGLPCVRFDGSSVYFNFVNSFLAPNRTLYAVVKIPGSSAYTLTCGAASSIQWRLDSNKQRLVKTNVADIGFGSTVIPNNTWTQINMSWDGQNGIFRTAAAADGTVSYGSTIYGQTRVFGYNPSDTAEYYATDLALLLEYAALHTLSQKQSVEAWINGVWGV